MRGVGDGEARRETVRAVDHHVRAAQQVRSSVGGQSLRALVEDDMRVDPVRCVRRRRHLARADIGIAKHGLALEIGKIDRVVIDDDQPPNPGCRQILDGRAANTACANNRNRCRLQPHLPRATNLAQHDVAGVAVQLFVGQRHRQPVRGTALVFRADFRSP